MFTVQNFSASGVATAAASDRPLSDSELALLRDEYAKDPARRGYAGTSGEALAALLCQPYTVPNPVPQGRVPKASLPGDAVRRFISSGILKVQIDAVLAAKWLPQIPIFLGLIGTTVDLANPDPTLQGSLQAAIADGIFAADDWAALTTDPDPAWQSELSFDSRLMQVLGIANAVLTAADLAQVSG